MNPEHRVDSARASRSPADPQASGPTPPAGAGQTIDSQSLLRGQGAVTITHNGAVYRLQATRQGKLILTK